MIYIKRKNFVFIKIPKNSSSSITKLAIDKLLHHEDACSAFQQQAVNMVEPHGSHSHMDLQYIIDNNLATLSNNFYAIVRNPIERQLSLYLYRTRQKRINNPCVTDFRQQLLKGYITDHSWQMQLQSSYTTYNNIDYGTWFAYEQLPAFIAHLECLFETRLTLPMLNRSSVVSTSSLVDSFYTPQLKKIVSDYWANDIQLYENVKNANRTSGYRN